MWFPGKGQNQQGMWPNITMQWMNPWMPFAGMPYGMYDQIMGQFPPMGNPYYPAQGIQPMSPGYQGNVPQGHFNQPGNLPIPNPGDIPIGQVQQQGNLPIQGNVPEGQAHQQGILSIHNHGTVPPDQFNEQGNLPQGQPMPGDQSHQPVQDHQGQGSQRHGRHQCQPQKE
jgi:hypothetical protein